MQGAACNRWMVLECPLGTDKRTPRLAVVQDSALLAHDTEADTEVQLELLLGLKLTSTYKHLLGPGCVCVRGDPASRHPNLMQHGQT